MTKCQNCGEEIFMLPGAGPWIHTANGAIECECPLYAEAAPHSEKPADYVSFEHEPQWSVLEGR